MSTTECRTEFKPAAGAATAGLGKTIVLRLKSAWRALRNRIASQGLSEMDDRMLDDIGLSRQDIIAALDRSGALDDPSMLLARAARLRARTRFQCSARR